MPFRVRILLQAIGTREADQKEMTAVTDGDRASVRGPGHSESASATAHINWASKKLPLTRAAKRFDENSKYRNDINVQTVYRPL